MKNLYMNYLHSNRNFNFNPVIKEILDRMIIECLGKDEYVYVLDWHHECYKFYVKKEMDSSGQEWHPGCIPDGDYYFYMAQDLSWAYLTHPWQLGLYAYGEKMVNYLRRFEKELGLELKYLKE